MITKVHNRLIGLQRYLLWNWLGNSKSYYVSEFPKSGGTWFCQMLSDLVDLPFPRNQFVTDHSYILHSHLLPRKKHKNPIVIVRDGRDVMISAYYHFIIPNDHCPDHEQQYWRSLLNSYDYNDVKNNLFQFIEVFHSNYGVGGQNITWQQHLIESNQQSSLTIKYEDLLKDPKKELVRATKHLNQSATKSNINAAISKYSFETLKRQNPSSNFLRKGIQGDWKNYFSFESGKLFHQLGGVALSKFGYISDSHWYEQLEK